MHIRCPFQLPLGNFLLFKNLKDDLNQQQEQLEANQAYVCHFNHCRELIPHPSVTVLENNIGHYPQLEDPYQFMFAYSKFLYSF